MPNLNDKYNYVTHIRLVDQALNHGLILCRVHRVIEFNQIAWMRPCRLNTSMRMATRNDFEKGFCKLMVNSVFGKTMERVDRHQNIKFAMTENQLNHLECKPNRIRTYDFGNNSSVVELSNTQVKEHKPIYSGQAILDISKMLLYEFHYGYMVPKYRSRQHLMYNDTDSTVYEIQTKNFYTDISLDVDIWFDTSNYPPNLDRPLPKGRNKMVLSKMKDEVAGSIITKSVALRSKSCSWETLGSSTCCTKGVKHYITEGMTHADFESILLKGKQIYKDQLSFTMTGHIIMA